MLAELDALLADELADEPADAAILLLVSDALEDSGDMLDAPCDAEDAIEEALDEEPGAVVTAIEEEEIVDPVIVPDVADCHIVSKCHLAFQVKALRQAT